MNKNRESSSELKISKLSIEGKIFTGGFSEVVKGQSLSDLVIDGSKSSYIAPGNGNCSCYNFRC